ncbi:hypothetical protein FA95DRAFT_1612139 [Auriscalpium vulgare]|uniref:Uncharacterized protein n=1 Tax=Auriscalpium vulgare TaxID=40419 RepID=A0ACB8R8P1_9AGAM|nr:hypothetical protein FA95DRAFT_1612139 [Auriscalpium vulgare]
MDASAPLPLTRHMNFVVCKAAKPSQSTSHHTAEALSSLQEPAAENLRQNAGELPSEQTAEDEDPVAESHEHYIADMIADLPRRKRRCTNKSGKKNRVALLTDWMAVRDVFMDELI